VDKPYGSIYIAICKINGKAYVGQTTFTVEERWQRHLEDHKGKFLFGKALLKHGSENFTLCTLDTASDQNDLDQKEIHWIKVKGTLVPQGYNLTEGGRGGKHSQESKDKMSASRKGKPLSEGHRLKVAAGLKARYEWERSQGIHRPKTEKQLHQLRTANLGKTVSPEVRVRMSAAMRGLKRSQEGCLNISIGKKGKSNGHEGKMLTPETKAKIGLANTGKKRTPETKEKMREAQIRRQAKKRAEKILGPGWLVPVR